ncbi:MAG: hypothetical protein HKP55_14545 [Gammaproteobacteria bacterium]|nr:hypothetical protein [Gammaproteobacteria bacterium]NNJ92892.1 hypothetical protein [Gammaproteobacteria bacterium]
MVRIILIFVTMMLAMASGISFSHEKNKLKQLINPHEKKAILEGKILTTVFLKNHGTYSNHSQSDSIEALTLPYSETTDYSVYEMLAVEKAFIPFDLDAERFLPLFNSLTAYSQFAGIHYYSRMDKKIQPYILSSYRITSPQNDMPVDDEKHDSIPADYAAYFMIEDNRFGKLLMQSHVLTQNNNIDIRNRTLEPMARLFIPINNAGEYEQQVFFLYDTQVKGFYYYSMQAMRIRSELLLKLGQLTPFNFASRLRALTVHFAMLLGHDWKDRLIPDT